MSLLTLSRMWEKQTTLKVLRNMDWMRFHAALLTLASSLMAAINKSALKPCGINSETTGTPWAFGKVCPLHWLGPNIDSDQSLPFLIDRRTQVSILRCLKLNGITPTRGQPRAESDNSFINRTSQMKSIQDEILHFVKVIKARLCSQSSILRTA